MKRVKGGKTSRIEPDHCIDMLVITEERDKIWDQTIPSHVSLDRNNHFYSEISSMNQCYIYYENI